MQTELKLKTLVIAYDDDSRSTEIGSKYRAKHKEIEGVKFISTHHTRTGRMLVCLITDPAMRVTPAKHYGGAECDNESKKGS